MRNYTEKAPQELETNGMPSSNNDKLNITLEDLQAKQKLAEDLSEAYPTVGTAEDVASLLGVPVTTVRALCRQGILEGFKVGNLWRIPRATLISFVSKGGCNG